MSIASKLFFESNKEYPVITASHVNQFLSGKNYETDLNSYINEIKIVEIRKNDTVDYIQYMDKDGNILNNVRGGLIENVKKETAENIIFTKYKEELMDFVFTSLLGG